MIFTATPQGYCASVISEAILSKTKIIDLSADFRIKDVDIYEKWYGIKHQSPQFIEEAVYGLCEINREEIRQARLVANPGCYTTCSILTAYPLAKEGVIDMNTLIVDAKSGTSGAEEAQKLPISSARSMKISRPTALRPTATRPRSRNSFPMLRASRSCSTLRPIWFR